MDTNSLLLITLGIFAVTFPVRFIPLVACNRIKIPNVVKVWLGYLPVSIFAALLAQVFYRPGKGTGEFIAEWPLFAAAVVSFIIAIKTRSIGWGVAGGFVLFLILVIL